MTNRTILFFLIFIYVVLCLFICRNCILWVAATYKSLLSSKMDYCQNETLAIFELKNLEGQELRISLYKIFVPILLGGCLLSIILNSILVAVGNISRNTRGSRSPILVLSLNLAVTDALASVLNGISLVINSFLPVVLNIKISTACITLVLEMLRLSALIASAMHLLALALIHYKGIVSPLQYR